ncbi:protein of unknown function [Limimonas halophila]|uniref:YfiR family protein n=1 Tax=Limimonas halophila TaxID=1082479 RepID=A0A1G7T0B8_9PROT|nr:YfiR family protein [Limimonas halophila]SDG28658.1 protein of unknown function [Limimonas halophila]
MPRPGPPSRQSARRWLVSVAAHGLVAAALGFTIPATTSGAAAASADDVKAGFVFNFAKFVTWPGNKQPGETLTLCFQRGSIAPSAYARLTGKTVRGATVRTRTVAQATSVPPACHLLVLAGERPPPTAIRRTAERRAILLIGDGRGFVRRGGHIGLMRRGGKLRFRVNLSALTRSGLQVRAGLLRLAEEVIRKGNG